ncbi:MAG: hypothetical protein PVG11_01765 [Anaerolineae bacterium]|jgi:hypothetical protein
MTEKPYTLDPTEKATPVMIGTADMLMWGDLITKQAVRMSAFLNTLAEDFVPLHDAKVLFLAPRRQVNPVERSVVYVKLEEILIFFSMAGDEPLPEESEVRRYDPMEAAVGSFRVEGQLLKSPIATLQNLLIVSKDAYMPFYHATVHHAGNPWLGSFASDVVQLRRDSMTVIVP